MQRKDGPQRRFDSSLTRSLRLVPPARPVQDSESSPAENLGDLAERTAPSWEAAWIDLGGEG